MYFCFSFGSNAEEAINTAWMKKTFIFYYFGTSVANGGFLKFLIFSLASIIPAVIATMLISLSFIKILTTKRTAKKIEYNGKSEKTSSPYGALLKKEIKRFFTSTAYIMNGGMGVVMTLVLCVIGIINAPSILNAIEVEFSDPSNSMPKEIIYGFIPVILAIIVNFVSSMNMISAPSISLENKNLWILQSLPVRPQTILFAKITNHIIISVPVTVIGVTAACIAYKVSIINTVLVILACASLLILTAYFGMFLGLKFPKFEWQNENVAVKQGFAVFGAMFGSMIYAMIVSVGGFLLALISPTLGLAAMILPNVLFGVLLHLYFVYKSDKDFEKLKDK